MTKPGLVKVSDVEKTPLKNEEASDDNKDAVKCGGRKLHFFLTSISPFPIYAFIAVLVIQDKCISQYDPIPSMFLMGFFASVELYQLCLFSPPKANGFNKFEDMEVIDYNAPEVVNDVPMKRIHTIHCLLTLSALYSFVSCFISTFFQQVSPTFMPWFVFSCLVMAHLIALGFYKIYKSGRWMTGYSDQTTHNSILMLAASTTYFLVSILFSCSSSLLSIYGSFGLLASILHLRFAYFFKNPPKWFCILTIKHSRNFLNKWYGWMVLMDGVLWLSLFVTVMFMSNDGSCVSSLSFNLLIFCIFAPASLIVKIIQDCLMARRTTQEVFV